MKKEDVTRRTFLTSASAGTVAAVAAGGNLALGQLRTDASKPAILGGKPIRSKSWPKWPVWAKEDEELVLSVLRSGVWSRAGVVKEFEANYAELIGAKRCLATTNGTNALLTSLEALKIGAGDEVLVSSYTWIATIDVILLTKAMPVFIDTDPLTFQMNPEKIEEKITANTRAILPVHILGLPADMHRINAIAKKHDLSVVEDACQAWLAELDHKKVGTFGNLGCFSFQNSKHITCGEGGAVVGDDDALMDRCYSYHNFGRPCGSVQGNGFVVAGNKCRMAEYQAAILLGQMKRLEEQTATRNRNAAYLTSKIKDIPGIVPHKLYPQVTQAAYHLYPFLYKKDMFQGLSRQQFIRALRAEGIPASEGYRPMQGMDFLDDAFSSKTFRKIYSKEELDLNRYREANACPDNDRLCEEAVWLSQRLLLGTKEDMDDIAKAILRVYENRDKLV
jgi:dTDP-4-amino-4,6-dideoxygalactose transaminase